MENKPTIDPQWIREVEKVVCVAEQWIHEHNHLEAVGIADVVMGLQRQCRLGVKSVLITESAEIDTRTLELTEVEVCGAWMVIYNAISQFRDEDDWTDLQVVEILSTILEESGFWDRIIPCRTTEEQKKYWQGLIHPLLIELGRYDRYDPLNPPGSIALRSKARRGDEIVIVLMDFLTAAEANNVQG